MSRFIKIILSIAVLCFMANSAPIAVSANDGHVHDVKTEKYYCPMHPQVVSDKPGNCPICHMRLVRQGGQDAGTLSVVISETARKGIGIQTETVESRPLKKTIEAWGTVAHDPELYELQIEFLRQGRLNYERERNRTPVSQARGLTEREKIGIKLLDRGLSPEWIKTLEDAGVPDKRLLFHYSANGIWVYLELREQEASLVKKGDAVQMTLAALPGIMVDGRVEYVDSKVNDATRTIRARVLIDKVPDGLKPMMRVSGAVEINMGEGIAIPEEAPLFTGKRAIVFVEEKDAFSPREIILGQKVDGYYEVKEGLMAGEKIVSRGNFFIDSESRLKSALVTESADGSHSS